MVLTARSIADARMEQTAVRTPDTAIVHWDLPDVIASDVRTNICLRNCDLTLDQPALPRLKQCQLRTVKLKFHECISS